MAYRKSRMKYADKYGVSRASRKYNKSRSYVYFWKARWDGTVQPHKAWNTPVVDDITFISARNT